MSWSQIPLNDEDLPIRFSGNGMVPDISKRIAAHFKIKPKAQNVSLFMFTKAAAWEKQLAASLSSKHLMDGEKNIIVSVFHS